MKTKKAEERILLRILFFSKSYKSYMMIALICAFISVSLSLLAPVLIGKAVDSIIGPNAVVLEEVLQTLYLLGAAIGCSAIFQWVMTFCTNKIAFGTVKELREAAFYNLNRVPLKYIDQNAHGDLISRVINDIDQISEGLLQGFAQLFTGVITIIGTLVFMVVIHFKIAALVVVLTPLSLFVASFIAKRAYYKFREQSETQGELSGYVEEMLGNQKTVKTFRYEEKAQEHFEEINSRLYKCGIMAQFYSALTNPSTRFVNGIVYAAVGVVGAFQVMGGNLSIGQLSCFLSYANQYTKPFNEISGVITEMQAAFASARRVFAVIDADMEFGEDAIFTGEMQEQLKNSVSSNVEFEKVSFSYHPKKPLIQDLSFKAEAGQKIAIVGPTGCGKTTIINLLMRFYDVSEGGIKVNGVDIREMERAVLRNMYGMVLQETWLFHGTVRENIAYGKEGATEEEIIAAAKAAHAHNFIRHLPKGYDTLIWEDGENISQGQKQLLCIARVMLKKSSILILDEATSNIDTRTEKRIQKAFAKLMEGKTSFIVAHRLSTIQEADLILVMNEGKIIEQGNHANLISKGGFYTELYNSQFVVTT